MKKVQVRQENQNIVLSHLDKGFLVKYVEYKMVIEDLM